MGQWWTQAENDRLRFELKMAQRENERLRLQLAMREDGEQHLLGEVEARDAEIAKLKRCKCGHPMDECLPSDLCIPLEDY